MRSRYILDKEGPQICLNLWGGRRLAACLIGRRARARRSSPSPTANELPTRSHAPLTERRRVILFAITTDAGTPREAARRIGAAVAGLGVERFDLIGEGAGAAAALWLALAPCVRDEAFREIKRLVLVLCGGEGPIRCRRSLSYAAARLPLHVCYDACRAIGAERPEALAYIAFEFFERRDLFLVRRESGMLLP